MQKNDELDFSSEFPFSQVSLPFNTQKIKTHTQVHQIKASIIIYYKLSDLVELSIISLYTRIFYH
jgi:hypothetical protein